MSLLVLSYIAAIVGTLTALVMAARQLLKNVKGRWIEEGAQAHAIKETSVSLNVLRGSVDHLTDKLDNIGDKLLDHETRIRWIERNHSLRLPRDD